MRALVVFDLDGTLVDSRRDIADAANALLAACGAPAPLSETMLGRMVGDGAGQLVSRAFAAAALPEPPDALVRFLALYDERLLAHTRPYPGIPDVVAAIAARTAVGVLTNKPTEATRRVLAGLDLARFFPADAVLGGDGPLPRKPDPAGLRHLAARVGVDVADALLIGDSLVDWRTARNAGASICLARYGYGYETFPADQLDGAELLVDAPADLLKLL